MTIVKKFKNHPRPYYIYFGESLFGIYYDSKYYGRVLFDASESFVGVRYYADAVETKYVYVTGHKSYEVRSRTTPASRVIHERDYWKEYRNENS